MTENKPDEAGTSNVYPFTSPSQLEPYKAFFPKARAPRLKIRCAGMRYAPPYSQLVDILSDEAGTDLELIFRFLIVKVRGKNLRKMIDAIENHGCDFIQEFVPRIFARPDATEPIIEAINFPEPAPEPKPPEPKPEANRK